MVTFNIPQDTKNQIVGLKPNGPPVYGLIEPRVRRDPFPSQQEIVGELMQKSRQKKEELRQWYFDYVTEHVKEEDMKDDPAYAEGFFGWNCGNADTVDYNLPEGVDEGVPFSERDKSKDTEFTPYIYPHWHISSFAGQELCWELSTWALEFLKKGPRAWGLDEAEMDWYLCEHVDADWIYDEELGDNCHFDDRWHSLVGHFLRRYFTKEEDRESIRTVGTRAFSHCDFSGENDTPVPPAFSIFDVKALEYAYKRMERKLDRNLEILREFSMGRSMEEAVISLREKLEFTGSSS